MDEFDATDYNELARGQRMLADREAANAAQQENPSMRALFEWAAKRALERAAKCERLAKAAGSKPAAPQSAPGTPRRPS